MIDQVKGLSKYRAVRGVHSSPYHSLVSRLLLGGVFLYARSSKIFDPRDSLPSCARTGSVCLSGSSPSWPTRCPRSRCCSGYSCSSSPCQGFGLDRIRVDDPVPRGRGVGGLAGFGNQLRTLWLYLRRRGVEPLGGRATRPRSSGSELTTGPLASKEVRSRRVYGASPQSVEVVRYPVRRLVPVQFGVSDKNFQKGTTQRRWFRTCITKLRKTRGRASAALSEATGT